MEEVSRAKMGKENAGAPPAGLFTQGPGYGTNQQLFLILNDLAPIARRSPIPRPQVKSAANAIAVTFNMARSAHARQSC